MTQKERAEFVKLFFESHCVKLMSTKGVEYSQHEEDVNSNFKRTSHETGVPPKTVLYIFMKKHWDSIASYIKTGEVKSEAIEGRIADCINYLFILASLIHEEKFKDYNDSRIEHGLQSLEIKDSLL